jgi:hypothetical protein
LQLSDGCARPGRGTLVARLRFLDQIREDAGSMSSHTSDPHASDQYTASEWTQQSMLGDMAQQKWLLIGVASLAGAVVLWATRRKAPEEVAARRLVRDWRNVDDAEDARDLLGSNVPIILRPVLLTALEEIEDQVHHLFRRLEREINRL